MVKDEAVIEGIIEMRSSREVICCVFYPANLAAVTIFFSLD